MVSREKRYSRAAPETQEASQKTTDPDEKQQRKALTEQRISSVGDSENNSALTERSRDGEHKLKKRMRGAGAVEKKRASTEGPYVVVWWLVKERKEEAKEVVGEFSHTGRKPHRPRAHARQEVRPRRSRTQRPMMLTTKEVAGKGKTIRGAGAAYESRTRRPHPEDRHTKKEGT